MRVLENFTRGFEILAKITKVVLYIVITTAVGSVAFGIFLSFIGHKQGAVVCIGVGLITLLMLMETFCDLKRSEY